MGANPPIALTAQTVSVTTGKKVRKQACANPSWVRCYLIIGFRSPNWAPLGRGTQFSIIRVNDCSTEAPISFATAHLYERVESQGQGKVPQAAIKHHDDVVGRAPFEAD